MSLSEDMEVERLKKHNNGMALVVVIISMMVLLILGTSILQISSFQSKHEAIERKGLQAQYLARAGAEAALKAWKNATNDHKPLGEFDKVYLTDMDTFVNLDDGKRKGYFVVYIVDAAAGSALVEGGSTTIRSVGQTGGVSKTVTVSLTHTRSNIFVPLTTGHDLGFYDESSGQLNPGVWPVVGKGTRGVVNNKAQNGKGLKHPSASKAPASLVYERMLFESEFQVVHNTVNLTANVIYFVQPIDFPTKRDPDANITLKVYNKGDGTATPIIFNNDAWGVLIIVDKAYYYKTGVILKSVADIQTNIDKGLMVEILDKSEIDKFKKMVTNGSIEVDSYAILWS